MCACVCALMISRPFSTDLPSDRAVLKLIGETLINQIELGLEDLCVFMAVCACVCVCVFVCFRGPQLVDNRIVLIQHIQCVYVYGCVCVWGGGGKCIKKNE